MNRTMQLMALFTILPLLTVSISMSANNAYGATNICGVQLCSDYPGGKSKFEEDKMLGYGYSVKSNSVIDPTMMMKTHDEKSKYAMKIADCMENMMMDEMMMKMMMDRMMTDEMMMMDEMMMDEMMMDEMMMDEMMMDEMMMDEMMMDEMMMDEMMMDEMMMDEMMMDEMMMDEMMMDEMMMDEMMMDEMMMDEMMMDEMMMDEMMMMMKKMMTDEMMTDEMMMMKKMMTDEMMTDEMMMMKKMMTDEMMTDEMMMMKKMMTDEMMMMMKKMMTDKMMTDKMMTDDMMTDEMMMMMKKMMTDDMMTDEMMMMMKKMMTDDMMTDEMMMMMKKMMTDDMMTDEMMMMMKKMMTDDMMTDEMMMMKKMMTDEMMMMMKKMMTDEMMMDHEFDCETYKMKYADKMHKKDSMHGDKMEEMRGSNDDEMKGMDHKKKVYLSRANVAAEIPLHEGYYNGDNVYYIITDASEQSHVDTISTNQDWNVAYAPLLTNAPESALSKTYMFVNGVDGNGVHGYQSEVFTTIPGQDNYSPLKSHVHVVWNDGVSPTLLTSEDDIETAAAQNKVTLIPLDVVINMPFIMWPNGQLQINENTITDHLVYGGGQITDIDLDDMTVTFIAHRGWGPDGSTIYYIVTDAIPSGPAEAMGVPHTPATASLLANPAAVDLYQFKNGLTGTGPLGFQPGIGAAGFGDDNYSPMWRIFLIEWNDADHASLLMTKGDIDAMNESGKITIELAMPMDLAHIVNCPFIDPFQ